jgi:hypothetical protein
MSGEEMYNPSGIVDAPPTAQEQALISAGQAKLAAMTGGRYTAPTASRTSTPPAHMPGAQRAMRASTPEQRQTAIDPATQLEERRQTLTKSPAYYDTNHPDHAKVMQQMRALLREAEVAESQERGDSFTNAELVDRHESRWGIDRESLPGGLVRTAEYDDHAAVAFGALADAGVDAAVVRDLVTDFERHAVANVGGPLSDGQLQVLYERFAPKLGEQLAGQLLDWYRGSVRGGAR